jgi:hypothetical protein
LEFTLKLETINREIARSEDFQEQNFAIGNPRLVIRLLRSKMYSNPIKVITQELMSNARDAHREIGKHATPIEVHLPTVVSPTWWVKDYGPGMCPKRIRETYIMYGNSTKRNDDTQTGGFGIGAKSPWAYTDTFTVSTVSGDGYKRIYTCYIDENDDGKLALMSEEATNEPTGTTISLSVKNADMGSFNQYTIAATKYWSTRPVIHGNHNYPDIVKSLSGKDWYLYNNGNNYNTHMIVLVDEIPYPIDSNVLKARKGWKRDNTKTLLESDIVVSFNTSEISVAATREALDLNEKTINGVITKLEQIYDEVSKQAEDEIKQAGDFLEALNISSKLKAATYIDLDTHWNGLPLIGIQPGEFMTRLFGIRRYNRNQGKFDNRYYYGDMFKDASDVGFVIIDDSTSPKDLHARIYTMLQSIGRNFDNLFFIKHANPVIPSVDHNNRPLSQNDRSTFQRVIDTLKQCRQKKISEWAPAVGVTASPSGSTRVKSPVVKALKAVGMELAPYDIKLKDVHTEFNYYCPAFNRQIKLGKHLHPSTTFLSNLLLIDFSTVLFVPERFSKQLSDEVLHISELIQEKYDWAIDRMSEMSSILEKPSELNSPYRFVEATCRFSGDTRWTDFRNRFDKVIEEIKGDRIEYNNLKKMVEYIDTLDIVTKKEIVYKPNKLTDEFKELLNIATETYPLLYQLSEHFNFAYYSLDIDRYILDCHKLHPLPVS